MPATLDDLYTAVHDLAEELRDNAGLQQGAFDDLRADLHSMNSLLMLVVTKQQTDWKTDLAIRLTSRKLWAFVAGLFTVIVTAWQMNPNPNVTIGAIAVAVVGYIASQAAEDRAKAKASVAAQHESTSER